MEPPFGRSIGLRVLIFENTLAGNEKFCKACLGEWRKLARTTLVCQWRSRLRKGGDFLNYTSVRGPVLFSMISSITGLGPNKIQQAELFSWYFGDSNYIGLLSVSLKLGKEVITRHAVEYFWCKSSGSHCLPRCANTSCLEPCCTTILLNKIVFVLGYLYYVTRDESYRDKSYLIIGAACETCNPSGLGFGR